MLRRTRNAGTADTVVGSAAWEYVPGDAHLAPRLLIVAGRGAGRGERASGVRWDLLEPGTAAEAAPDAAPSGAVDGGQ